VSQEEPERFDFVEISETAEEAYPPPGLADEDPMDALRAAEAAPPLRRGPFLRVVEVIGSPGRQIGQLDHPLGVCVDSAGSLYVAEGGHGRVQRISPEGEVWAYTGKGTGRGDWQETAAVAVDARGMLYILERRACRVQKIGADALYQHTFGMEGSSFSQLSGPSAIALDSRNNVYVADTRNSRISVFEPNGRFREVLRGEEAGGFRGPRGVTITRDDEIVVCDTANARLVVLSWTGTLRQVIEGLGPGQRLFSSPVAVAEDPYGGFWVVDETTQQLVKIGRDGVLLHRVGPHLGQQLSPLSDPSSVCVRADGDVYLCDTGNGRILRLGYRA
jgi:tripartite motif-containing protein 71